MRRIGRKAAVFGVLAAALAVTPAASANTRIAVLNGDLAEVVYALGYGERIVGLDTSATYPAAAREAPKFGYQRSLAAEPILALSPTLIIGSDAAGPPAVIQQLRGSGVPVRIFPSPRGVSGIGQKIRNVGAAIGGQARGRARELAAAVQRRLARAKRRVVAEDKPRVAFLYIRGQQVQQLGGRGSGADSMIRSAGGIDVGSELGFQGFRPLTPEALVQARPDHIVVLSAGLQSVGGIDGLLQLPGVAQTPAGQNRRVLAFDDQLFLGLGPRAPRALRALIRGLRTDRR
jgi:iron complex transport system substrate-binding protein